MLYKSTRNSALRFSASQAIAKGISEEGGLFVPEAFPNVKNKLSSWSQLDYGALAEQILKLYLTDFTAEEISSCVSQAYDLKKFEGGQPVKLQMIKNGFAMLELWHGPTCAFKDMALQLLPQLLSVSMKKQAEGKTAFILVATSGDTGKAALEGFRNVEGTRIVIFYPEDGVSHLQKLQMATQDGENVMVCAVKGNFDDTQTGVKQVFTDSGIRGIAGSKGLFFSSANSINFGRLLPQIIYYFYSYFELYREGRIKALTEPINIAVPTGNFGNILAGYYASKMGLPINKFICASNENNVLTEFIDTGVYNRKRRFFTTVSPSMDILISSNLERLIYHLCAENSGLISDWMQDLSDKGEYKVDEETARELRRLFYGGFSTDSQTKQTIGQVFESQEYLCDTHTAVAVNVYEKYLAQTGDKTPVVIVSTASPYKFADHVLEGLGQLIPENPFEQLKALQAYTGIRAQHQLKELEAKAVRFSNCIEVAEMKSYVVEKLKYWKADN